MGEDIIKEESYQDSMTKEQAEAYNTFIDYMVELYRKYGHLLDEADKVESVV